MTKKFKALVLMAVIFLQVTVLSHFTPFSVIPNYTFVVIVALSLVSPNVETVMFSFLSGILTDMLTGAPLGLNTLIFMYLSIGCALLAERIYNKQIKVVWTICFAASFVYELLFGIFSSLLRGASFYSAAIVRVVLPVAVMNTVIFIPAYWLLNRIRFEKKRKGIRYEQPV